MNIQEILQSNFRVKVKKILDSQQKFEFADTDWVDDGSDLVLTLTFATVSNSKKVNVIIYEKVSASEYRLTQGLDVLYNTTSGEFTIKMNNSNTAFEGYGILLNDLSL